MKRREFIASTMLTWPLGAHAQKAPAHIGMLLSGTQGSRQSAAEIADFNEGLRGYGLIEGRDYVLKAHFAAGHYERFPELAHGLAQSGVALILGDTIAAVRAAQGLVVPLPIIMLAANDPVGNGLVATLARPGGHTTGMATQMEDVTPKMLEFMRSTVPSAKTLGLVFNPANPSNPKLAEYIRNLAGPMGLAVRPFPLMLPDELKSILDAFAAVKPDLIQVVADAANYDMADGLATFALAHRLPIFIGMPEVIDFGGLLGYGPSRRKLFGRAAYFAKRILGGANPSDLPVEQPNSIELGLNQQTAKAIGVTFPPNLVTLADRVIE